MKGARLFCALAASLAATTAAAVHVSPDGRGQALIYPYYTVQRADGNYWNTYLTVVNHQSTAKVLRVRFREGRNGREVLAFNLFLAPEDTWTAAVVPSAESDTSRARILSADQSCTSPRIALEGLDFGDAAYRGANADGLGEGLDRTREGYVEVIEMATLTGAAALAVMHDFVGRPANCAAVQAPAPDFTGNLAAPGGGLSGTYTLINVSRGMDMAGNADALADLTAQPFYRPPGDPYPDFDAAEVRPVTNVVANGKHYRLTWPRGVDAVSAALTRVQAQNEYVLDPGTRSASDWVMTFPTRRFYVTPGGSLSPFDRGGACVTARVTLFNREELASQAPRCLDYVGRPCSEFPRICHASTTLSFGSAAASSTSRVFGSTNVLDTYPLLEFQPTAGWAAVSLDGDERPLTPLRSLADSSSWDLATGVVSTGRFEVRGLPVTGFGARTFENGTLSCAERNCQGNYGGSFQHNYRRSITSIP